MQFGAFAFLPPLDCRRRVRTERQGFLVLRGARHLRAEQRQEARFSTKSDLQLYW